MLTLSGVLFTSLFKAIYVFESFYVNAERSLALNEKARQESVLLHHLLGDVGFNACGRPMITKQVDNNETFIEEPQTLGVDVLASGFVEKKWRLKRGSPAGSNKLFVRKTGKYYAMLHYHGGDSVQVDGLLPRFRKRSSVVFIRDDDNQWGYVRDSNVNYARKQQRLSMKSEVNASFKKNTLVFPWHRFVLYLAKNAHGVMSLYQKEANQRNRMLLEGVKQLVFANQRMNGKPMMLVKSMLCIKQVCRKNTLLIPLLS